MSTGLLWTLSSCVACSRSPQHSEVFVCLGIILTTLVPHATQWACVSEERVFPLEEAGPCCPQTISGLHEQVRLTPLEPLLLCTCCVISGVQPKLDSICVGSRLGRWDCDCGHGMQDGD